MVLCPLNQPIQHGNQHKQNVSLTCPFQTAFHFANKSMFNCAGLHVRQHLVFILMNLTGAWTRGHFHSAAEQSWNIGSTHQRWNEALLLWETRRMCARAHILLIHVQGLIRTRTHTHTHVSTFYKRSVLHTKASTYKEKRVSLQKALPQCSLF